jgi:hypothetical protein
VHLYSPDCALVFLKKHKTIAFRSDFDLGVCSGSHKCIFILWMACCLFHAGITFSLMLDRNKQTVSSIRPSKTRVLLLVLILAVEQNI